MSEDLVSKWEQEIKQRIADSKAVLVGLSPQFKQAGIAFVVAFYDGEGDSGSIVSIQFCDSSAEGVAYEARSEGDLEGTLKCPKLHHADDESIEIEVEGYAHLSLESFFDDFCPAGYENNEGGFGAIIFNVETGKVRVNHAYRTTDYETNDYDA